MGFFSDLLSFEFSRAACLHLTSLFFFLRRDLTDNEFFVLSVHQQVEFGCNLSQILWTALQGCSVRPYFYFASFLLWI